MAINDGRDPADPRTPHAGEDRAVDPLPTTAPTDPFGTRPGEIRPGETTRGAGPDPRPVDPVAARTDSTYAGSTARDDRMARPARRSGSAWAWAIGAVVVIGAILAFFLMDGYTATDVPVTGAIEEPAPAPVPIDPQADTPVSPTEPIEAQ
ncbi:hypothetical protein [Salinarimonas rosea]|uniref:hypothetical protein n=1 Tax=Salinarimonas rosea TaxID=552063 RepID=UPI0004177385|nr:hypothetical protein [Salinarimonas rosea]